MVTHKEIKSQNRKTVRSAKNSLQRPEVSGNRKAGILPGADLFRQRSLGNRYLQSALANQTALPKPAPNHSAPVIQRKCSCGGTCASCAAREEERRRIQPKLKVGAANDVYEREADRVAEQVMRMPEQTANNQSQPGIQIQRISAGDSAGFDADIHLNQSGGQPLSAATRRYMEPRFGMDFSPVRLHAGPQAQQSAEQIQARAFTCGNHIWLGEGAAESDRGLMAHELAHVVQQHKVVPGNSAQTPITAPESNIVHRLPFGIRLPSGVRLLDPTEEAIARPVYGSSLNYGAIYLSDALGGRGRPFTTYVPLLGGTMINIGPSAYATPGSDPNLLIHEIAHSWQSQHHPQPAQFMANSVASQAAAEAVGGDSYCYIPGKWFGSYGAEQIAQQIENGEAPIIAHIRSVSVGVPDLANIASLSIPRWETRGASGVTC